MIERENAKWAEKHPGEIRIDPDGEYEVWVHQSLKDAYAQLFGKALEDWNKRQIEKGHKERIIKDYLSDIRKKEKTSKNAKKVAYELIHSVGSKDDPVDPVIGKSILEEAVRSFQERNPNLHVICQAFHNDEIGVMHCHTTYIPVAYDCKRGLETQNSLSAALKQQGIVVEEESISSTPQMAFVRKENELLEAVCNKYGYQVDHPMRDKKQEHLSIEAYKLKKELEELQKKLAETKELPLGTTAVKTGRLQQLESIEKQYIEDKPKIEAAKRELSASRNAMEAYTNRVRKLEEDERNFAKRVNEAANRKLKALSDKGIAFIKTFGLWQKFCMWVTEQSDRKQAKQHQ